jgi:hypothetical protein
MRYHSRSQYAKVRLMVLYHPADPECAGVIRGYRRLLRDGDDTVLDLPLDRLYASWSAAVGTSSHTDWLRDFGVRYLELDRSADVS